MAKKIKDPQGTVGVSGNRIKEGYEIGTPLKHIINLPSDATEQAKLMSTQPTMNAMNRLRWANYQGYMTEYPEGRNVPVFRYTPAVLEDMQKRGLTKEYIESWQPGNYGSKLDYIASSYADGGEVKLDTNALAELGADQLSDLLAGILSTRTYGLQKDLQEGIKNPAESMAKLDRRAVASDIAGTTLKGASTGLAVAGPIGAAIGGAAGLVGSGVKALLGADDRQEARNDARQDWSQKWAGTSARNLANAGYAEGGKIKGKGTGKSDDINMKVPEGSFIVPAENSSKAMSLGQDYLGWGDKEVASRNYGNVDINVSNGEVYFTPEEYEVLSYYGVDVDDLAPNAEKNQTGFCRGGKIKRAEGGSVPSPEKAREMLKNPPYGKALTKEQERYFQALAHGWKPDNYHEGGGVHPHPHMDIETLNQQNQEYLERDINNPLNTYVANSMAQLDKDVQAETFRKVAKVDLPEKKSAFDKFMENVGMVAGAAQVAGGTAGLIAAGRRPDVNVSSTLKSISRTAREAAGYGLPPAAKNALKNERERILKSTMNEIASKGGSAQEINSKMLAALSTSLAAAEKTELADYQAREEKVKRSQAIDMKIGDQEYDISKIGLESWERDQDVWANLIAAGVENTIGAKQFNEQLKWMKENTDRSINFTLPT